MGNQDAFRPTSKSVLVSHQKRLQADPIQFLGRLGGDAAEVGQSGQEVNGGGYLRNLGAWLDALGPANEQGRPHAAFVGGAFSTSHVAVPAGAVGSVVVKEEDDGIVGDV